LKLKKVINNIWKIPIITQRLYTENSRTEEDEDAIFNISNSTITVTERQRNTFNLSIMVQNSKQTIAVDKNDYVIDLKQLLFENENIPIDAQRLFYMGKELNIETNTLESYNIGANSTLHLFTKIFYS